VISASLSGRRLRRIDVRTIFAVGDDGGDGELRSALVMAMPG
jgi:hypothetical protein